MLDCLINYELFHHYYFLYVKLSSMSARLGWMTTAIIQKEFINSFPNKKLVFQQENK